MPSSETGSTWYYLQADAQENPLGLQKLLDKASLFQSSC